MEEDKNKKKDFNEKVDIQPLGCNFFKKGCVR